VSSDNRPGPSGSLGSTATHAVDKGWFCITTVATPETTSIVRSCRSGLNWRAGRGLEIGVDVPVNVSVGESATRRERRKPAWAVSVVDAPDCKSVHTLYLVVVLIADQQGASRLDAVTKPDRETRTIAMATSDHRRSRRRFTVEVVPRKERALSAPMPRDGRCVLCKRPSVSWSRAAVGSCRNARCPLPHRRLHRGRPPAE